MTKRWVFWLALGVLFFVFLYLIRSILLPFVLGMFSAYFLDPAADRLEKWGFSRTVSTLIITFCFFVCFVLLSILVVPVIAEQLAGLIASWPDYMNQFNERFSPQLTHWLGEFRSESIQSAVTDFSGMVAKFTGDFMSGLFQSGMAIVTFFSLILITPVVSFYLLRDWDRMIARIDSYLPRAHAKTIRQQARLIDQTLAGFVRGQLNVCLLLGAFYAISLSLIGLKFGIVIGLITGLLVIVPYVGWMLGATTGLAVAFFQFESYPPILAVLAVFVVGMCMEGYAITPKLVGEKVGLHPVWIIFGMLAGAALFGFVGVLLAVPVTAVLGVLIRFAIQQYLDSHYYRSEPAARKR